MTCTHYPKLFIGVELRGKKNKKYKTIYLYIPPTTPAQDLKKTMKNPFFLPFFLKRLQNALNFSFLYSNYIILYRKTAFGIDFGPGEVRLSVRALPKVKN